MKRLSLLTLVFAILSVFFFLILVALRFPSPFNPLMSVQDILDILTSPVLLPVYWLMFRGMIPGKSNLTIEIFFIIMAAFWAMGQGMHLSANSINNLIGYLADNQGVDVSGSDIYTLTYFYDEHLSHYLWHIGVLGLAAVLIYVSWIQPALEKTDWRYVIPAAILYGINYFCIFLEGGTLPIGLPFAIIVTLVVLIWGRSKISQQPILAFFFLSCALASVLFTGWRLYWKEWIPILEALEM